MVSFQAVCFFQFRQIVDNNNMAATFQYKVIAITGGGSGIGAALANDFATAGAIVVIVNLKGSKDVVKSFTQQQ
jgi:NADP-dependent 3-hydroxy acid dehydrogenase YdfG